MASSSPWLKIEHVEPVNLQDIMSEEVAKDLQAKEDKKYQEFLRQVDDSSKIFANEILTDEQSFDEVYESDAAIALMLQKQYDKEYDEILKRTEDKFNGSSKVSVSYCNYRRSDNVEEDSESEDELIDIIDRKDWDRFDTVERCISGMPRCGYMKQDGNMVTKHDITLSSRKNACKFMSFPPEFPTGDGAGFDLRISNKVFNSLKAHSSKEQARRHRIHDKKEDQATAELGVDEFTRLILFKLINKQLLERVNGVISTGKEAVILHAETDPSYTECVLPKECVVKVFKTTLSEFKQRDRYIRDDIRFKNRYGKQNSRKMVQLWAEKEMRNLMRLQKAGIPCPDVVTLKSHVLVMSFIGENHKPAPKLKDVVLKPVDWIIAYEQVVETMKTLYSKAKLIHADLSEYNILWHDNKCWFIDVSQSIEPIHPRSHHFLFRDCTNVSGFFNRKGVPEVKEPNDLFIDITGYDYFDRTIDQKSGNKSKPKPHHEPDPDDEHSNQFEYEWENSKTNKVPENNIINDTEKLHLVDPPVA